ncbi:uncharacterized protein LOC128885391 [Hylaeus anthracinus]|uniref:uncharacterized protein LOC128885391 n=1 Tax=Hylaeus anthracinus TaxID=313031 RepID=UPI0023BA005D|nr:uncharacterized protein LOC128885391 [Hylaeus anthracinus]
MYTTYISMVDVVAESTVDLKNFLGAEYHQLGIFVDCRCDSERYAKIFTDATRHSMYDEMHKWLILGSNLTHSLEILNDEAFSVSTDVVIAVPSRNDYVLYDVYNPCKDRGGATNVTVFGTWNGENGLNVTLNQPKFQRRSNLHGMRLKVGIVASFEQLL